MSIYNVYCKSCCSALSKVISVLLAVLLSFNTNGQITVLPELDNQVFEVSNLQEISFANIKADENSTYHLIWNGCFSSVVLSTVAKNKKLNYKIPDYLNQKSGVVSIVLSQAENKVYKATFYIKAGEAIGTINTFTGPKTVNLDTLEKALVLCIPKDKYQNPVETNKPVNFKGIQANKATINYVNETQNLIAYLPIQPENIKGKIVIGATIEKANCNEQEIDVEAGKPIAFKLSVTEQFPYADERQQTIVSTNILKDVYGNTVADGTNVDFLYNFNGKQNCYKSFTVNGIAVAAIQNPKQAGSIKMKALVSPNTYSKSLNINYESAIVEIPLKQEKETIIVGPVYSQLGQYYSNGTTVRLNINDTIYTELLENGMAYFELPPNTNINKETIVNVTIAGKQQTIRITR